VSTVRTLVLLAALLVSTTFAGAAEDIAAGRAVIRSQERAFGRDDGATAYTFASPSIKMDYTLIRRKSLPVYLTFA
jgi:hypothetical protein